MKLYAVIADIHGNYPALQAVSKDAQKIAKKEGLDGPYFICLGDVVDYGPQPNECMAWVDKYCLSTIRGNHDEVVALTQIWRIRKDYQPITLWTMKVLDSSYKQLIQKWKQTQQDLPRFTLFHGSLLGGPDGRVDDHRLAQANMDKLSTEYGLFGHTHYQGYFEQGLGQAVTMFLTCPNGDWPNQSLQSGKGKAQIWQPVPLGEWMPLPEYDKALFNPGSVGQPRKHASAAHIPHDHRAAYMLLQLNDRGEGRFQFRRVEYDVDATIQRLKKIHWPQEEAHRGTIYPNPLLSSEDLSNMPELLSRCIEDILIPTLLGKRL